MLNVNLGAVGSREITDTTGEICHENHRRVWPKQFVALVRMPQEC